MKIITLNMNGIRASAKKGVFGWFAKQDADVICLQEVRASADILEDAAFQLPGYHCYYEPAERKGYSGVGLLCRQKPDQVVRRLGIPVADSEGRYIEATWGDLTVASLYLPSGTSGDERLQIKYQLMDDYGVLLEKYLKENRKMIICGDINIAHQKIDLKNWRSNQKNSGFLPEERAWLDKWFDEKGWVDAFRVVNQEPEQYTWWSNRGRAWDNNTGWRIDYQVVSPNLKQTIKSAAIYKAERFSDHAPLIMEYALKI